MSDHSAGCKFLARCPYAMDKRQTPPPLFRLYQHRAHSVSNEAAAPIQFIWSAHPLLAIEPGMRLLLPPEARFNRWVSIPPDLLSQASGLPYPPAISTGTRAIDLASLPDVSAGVALKLWSDSVETWRVVRSQESGVKSDLLTPDS